MRARAKKLTPLPDGPTRAHIGVAREDGYTKGEYSPILYPKRLFNLLHCENTWLSPTPDRPSTGWDAGSERILTTGVFEHKTTKQGLAAFNTRLDNAGSEAREKSLGLIIDVIEPRPRRMGSQGRCEYAFSTNDGGLSFFLAGDFNSFPNPGCLQGSSRKQQDGRRTRSDTEGGTIRRRGHLYRVPARHGCGQRRNRTDRLRLVWTKGASRRTAGDRYGQVSPAVENRPLLSSTKCV